MNNWKWTKNWVQEVKMEQWGGWWPHRIKSGYFYQVSLLDYFLEIEPKVGVTFPAGIRPFFVLQDSRSARDKELNWNMARPQEQRTSFTSRNRNNTSSHNAFTDGGHVLLIKGYFSHLQSSHVKHSETHHHLSLSKSLDQIKKKTKKHSQNVHLRQRIIQYHLWCWETWINMKDLSDVKWRREISSMSS